MHYYPPWENEKKTRFLRNSIIRFSVRDAHAKSFFEESGATRHSPQKTFGNTRTLSQKKFETLVIAEPQRISTCVIRRRRLIGGA
jgi:hypothetical protein